MGIEDRPPIVDLINQPLSRRQLLTQAAQLSAEKALDIPGPGRILSHLGRVAEAVGGELIQDPQRDLSPTLEKKRLPKEVKKADKLLKRLKSGDTTVTRTEIGKVMRDLIRLTSDELQSLEFGNHYELSGAMTTLDGDYRMTAQYRYYTFDPDNIHVDVQIHSPKNREHWAQLELDEMKAQHEYNGLLTNRLDSSKLDESTHKRIDGILRREAHHQTDVRFWLEALRNRIMSTPDFDRSLIDHLNFPAIEQRVDQLIKLVQSNPAALIALDAEVMDVAPDIVFDDDDDILKDVNLDEIVVDVIDGAEGLEAEGRANSLVGKIKNIPADSLSLLRQAVERGIEVYFASEILPAITEKSNYEVVTEDIFVDVSKTTVEELPISTDKGLIEVPDPSTLFKN